MPGARGKATKAALVEDARDRPLRNGDREALGQPVAQIDTAPAHNAVGSNIRPGFNPLLKLGNVLGLEVRWPPGARPIPCAVHDTATKRCSVSEWTGSEAKRAPFDSAYSMISRVSPCIAHLAVLPLSQSKSIRMYVPMCGQSRVMGGVERGDG